MGPSTKVMAALAAVAIVIVALAGVVIFSNPSNHGGGTTVLPPPQDPSPCPRSAGLCVERIVTRVIDGDTLVVEGDLRIRLVLVDAPELDAPNGFASKNYLSDLCLGSLALIDEDDWQIGDDPYGRVLALVRCRGTNANAAMIASEYADTYYTYCSRSEFGTQAWTGCSSGPPPDNCDPAYPDVCIPPPPPDLDCGDIPYRNFRVLAPDPHRFDGDRDGIGCEA